MQLIRVDSAIAIRYGLRTPLLYMIKIESKDITQGFLLPDELILPLFPIDVVTQGFLLPNELMCRQLRINATH